MAQIDLTFAFTAGMLATINPCGWAMLPAFVAYYLGVDEADYVERLWVARLSRSLLVGLLVTTGFMLVFTVMGAVITFGLRLIVRYLPLGAIFVGSILLLLGGWLFFGGHLPLSLPAFSPQRARNPKATFLFGIAYGLVSLSCTLPVFLVVVGISLPQANWVRIAVMFLTYGAGMAAVLMFLAASTALFKGGLAHRARPLLPYVHRLGALLLMAAGIYLLWYQGRYLPVILDRLK